MLSLATLNALSRWMPIFSGRRIDRISTRGGINVPEKESKYRNGFSGRTR
ncbi:hypothetical protein P0O24_00495 [Methanotrichaceae archaeon M04Ac]|uniref:Uncharacterized protein n=1 Tax=Candidatus Methanocrinis alkalitolerans TaxID=3033395 RepID=A0ABT5XBH5_9EURY|nr:hypothetical protein [Candidatus Methanocrinis alkalitolerans]MCR3884355.1 hypothetical protein [Methanothrix sp.]MDF0592066.1 hypothetical protein [Candidatus Methanocrinis alkalitolerans]